jgi:hypothetical protein
MSLQDSWIDDADTHDLPRESIPKSLRTGQSGASFGWPNKMMGDTTFEKLHGQEITRTSQCIQLANCMTEAQFQEVCGGRPSWAYLVRCMRKENQTQIKDYNSRLRCWEADQCIINNRILEALLPQVHPADVIFVNGRKVRQLGVVNAAIAVNEARLKELNQVK